MADSFRHEALLYAGDEGFLAGTLPFIEEALSRGHNVAAAVSSDRIDLLRSRLNGHGDRVRFADMRSLGTNPGVIISAWRDFVNQGLADGRALWGIGEPVWRERSRDELGECHRHECLLNLAFADTEGFRLMCPYDTSELDPSVVDRVWLSHPTVFEEGRAIRSDRFTEIDGQLSELLEESLPEAAATPTELPFDAGNLPELRRAVLLHARDAGISGSRVQKLVLAVHELATNSLRHGGGAGTLRFWRDDDTNVAVYEVRDTGRIQDPLVGRLRPPAPAAGGHGLWLVNQLCELVQVRSSPLGTVVRLQMSRD